MIVERNNRNVSLIPPAKKKGASKTTAEKSNPFAKITLAKVILFTAVVVAVVIVYVSFLAVETALNVPVNQVNFERDFNYLSEEEVTEVINSHVTNGFLTVDLKKLQMEFKKLPWVYQANIKRKLPNGLSVVLEEQKPFAYWNDTALINTDGELFSPKRIPALDGLPKFTGTHYKSVIHMYDILIKALPADQLPVQALDVDERNTVTVVIKSGTKVIFNLSHITEQLTTWKTIASSELGARLSEVNYVDLRYSNGAAVSFLKKETNHSESRVGL